MLLGWGPTGVLYTLGALTPLQRTILPETRLDHAIPFSPAGVWVYLSFFALIPLTYFVSSDETLKWLKKTMQICAVVAGVVFVLWPTTLSYPPVLLDGLSAHVLSFVQGTDSRSNCLPSLHGALTVVCMWALARHRNRALAILGLVWGLAICYSVIQVRQHVAIDLGTGMLLGVFAGMLNGQNRRLSHDV